MGNISHQISFNANLDNFDFHLPQNLIALRPAEPRESAKLLEVSSITRRITNHAIADLTRLLKPSDLLIVNDTKVIPAVLKGVRSRAVNTHNGINISDNSQGAKCEVLLLERNSDQNWEVLIKPSRRIKVGDDIIFSPQQPTQEHNCERELKGCVIEKKESGKWLMQFNHPYAELMVLLSQFGSMPIPPYIRTKRSTDAQDNHDYQTIFADKPGGVAAPTAGLHLTHNMMEKLRNLGVEIAKVTLHTNIGTFKPVEKQDITSKKLHREQIEISAATAQALNKAKAENRRIIAVGTTSLRTLESNIRSSADGRHFHEFAGSTDIFIQPGDNISAADILITNFHLPKSSLYMLVCAFGGYHNMKTAYQHAINNQYRFYSYGDACFIHNQGQVKAESL